MPSTYYSEERDRLVTVPEHEPSTVAVDFHNLTARYIDLVTAGGMDEPLTSPVSAAAVINDLCSLAGVPVPEVVCQALGHDWGWNRQPAEFTGACVVCGALPF